MIENIMVALIVALAVLYVVKRYAPKWMAQKSGAWLAGMLAAIGMSSLSKAITESWMVVSPSGKSCGSGCGSCGGCGGFNPAHSASEHATANSSDARAVIKIHHRNSNIPAA